jgi:hypothetical protein
MGVFVYRNSDNNVLTWNNKPIINYTPVPGPAYPTDGLIARYAFEQNLEDSYGTTADITVDAETMAYSTSGKVGYGADMGGTSWNLKFVDASILETMNYDRSFSISYWIYLAGNCSVYPQFFRPSIDAIGGWYGTGPTFFGRDGTTQFTWGIAQDGVIDPGRTDTLDVSTWTHMVFTYDKDTNTQSYYINAGNVANEVWAGADVSMGAMYNPIGNPTRGHTSWPWPAGSKCDQMYFYNRVLSATDVSTLYNLGDGI